MNLRKRIEKEYVDSYKEHCEEMKLIDWLPLSFNEWVKFYSMKCLIRDN